ncbi:MAG TPA: dCMP deaminase family protein [Clostridiaceae bacterium]|nr:dCMP deaminase family protein [Clostridiaceae bacterium]
MSKREDYISWDEYFMGIALLAARRSKDPNTQVGACIVNDQNKIVSIGYNGFPRGCDDDLFPWAREGRYLETKYPYVTHAELNAILNSSGFNLEGCKIYVPLFPCNECSKAIIQSGIRHVYYLSDKYKDTDPVIASKRMFDAAGVAYEALTTGLSTLTLDYDADHV